MTVLRKILVFYVTLAVVILAVIGALFSARFRRDRLDDLQREMLSQLKHLDFAISGFIVEAENDVATLAATAAVRTREDQAFTSFLEADPATFEYAIGQTEQGIVDLFNSYRLTHAHVSSVYMGRENGSFVRSHPRTQPTQYDPRTRPWYVLGRDNPGKVMLTEPYPSVTNTDVNVGVVTALVDEAGEVYGVVGADITLVNLSQYLSGLEVGYGGQILLLDQSGTILASKDEALLFQPIADLIGDEAGSMLDSPEGVQLSATAAGATRLYHYTSPDLGWKIVAAVPEAEIQRQVRSLVLPQLVGSLAALALFSALSFASLNLVVIRPLVRLHGVTRDIARTGDLDQRAEITSRDEIGSLAASFNQMVVSIQGAQAALRRERDLAEALMNAAAALTATLDFETVLDLILEQVSRVIPNEACNVMIIEGQVVRAVRWRGYERHGADDFIARTEFSLLQTPSFRQMAMSKGPLLVPDVAERADWAPFQETSWLRSYAATPIIVRDSVIGFLSVDSSIPGYFEEHQLEPLRTFAGYAAAAISNARLYEQVRRDALDLEARVAAATQELRQRAEELAALNELSRALTTHLSVEQVLVEVYRGAARLMDAGDFDIALYDFDRDQLSSALRMVDGEIGPPLAVSRRELTDYLVRTQQPLLLPDRVVERMDELELLRAIDSNERIPASWLGVPIVLGERVLGTMVVQNYSAANTYHTRDRDLLWALASQAAIAINNAQLYRNSQQHAIELGILYEVAKEITATLELGTMLQTIADNVVRLVNADRSLLVLLDASKGRLIDIVGHGFDRVHLQAHTFEELQSGLTGWVLREKVPTLSVDLPNDERQKDTALASAQRSGDRSAAVAPLLIGDQVFGTLTVVNGPLKAVFGPAELNLVTMLANQASGAIQKAQLYEAAQEADRLKSAFLASMSHELRTPLNSIIGFTGILLQGLVGPLNDEQRKQLGMVMNSSRHLLALINDVLDISKIEAGGLELASESFDVREAIERVVQIVTPLAAKKGLQLVAEISPEVGRIVGDQRRLEQILINLVNNAVKFTEQGHVSIGADAVNNRLVFQVTDTGIGIRSEDLSKLFRPFSQVDVGLARRHEGTGLGLAICDRLVTMMGGKIWVDSQWGEGSTFAFALPLDDGRQTTDAPDGAASDAPIHRG